MTSLDTGLNFLSHIGFSNIDACNLMSKFNNDMSCLMICSNKDLIKYDVTLDYRLRLLRAIRCFHFEKWSKYLMNHFSINNNKDLFEKFIYHLIKIHIWIIYTIWTINYIRKYLIINQENFDDLFYKKLYQLKQTIKHFKEIIILIKENLSN